MRVQAECFDGTGKKGLEGTKRSLEDTYPTPGARGQRGVEENGLHVRGCRETVPASKQSRRGGGFWFPAGDSGSQRDRALSSDVPGWGRSHGSCRAPAVASVCLLLQTQAKQAEFPVSRQPVWVQNQTNHTCFSLS